MAKQKLTHKKACRRYSIILIVQADGVCYIGSKSINILEIEESMETEDNMNFNRLWKEFTTLPEVEAIALGGSRVNVFCNREVHSFATKNTQCCHPIVSV